MYIGWVANMHSWQNKEGLKDHKPRYFDMFVSVVVIVNFFYMFVVQIFHSTVVYFSTQLMPIADKLGFFDKES